MATLESVTPRKNISSPPKKFHAPTFATCQLFPSTFPSYLPTYLPLGRGVETCTISTIKKTIRTPLRLSLYTHARPSRTARHCHTATCASASTQQPAQLLPVRLPSSRSRAPNLPHPVYAWQHASPARTGRHGHRAIAPAHQPAHWKKSPLRLPSSRPRAHNAPLPAHCPSHASPARTCRHCHCAAHQPA